MPLIDLEHRSEPYKPENACTEQRYYGGHCRVTKAAQSAYHNIHDSAEKINGADDTDSYISCLYDRRIIAVYAEQFSSEVIYERAH